MLLSTDFCCIILRGRGIISVFLRKITLVLVSSIAAIVRFLFLCQRKTRCYSAWKQQALIHLIGRCRKGCYALFCHSDFLKCRVSLIKCRPPIPVLIFVICSFHPKKCNSFYMIEVLHNILLKLHLWLSCPLSCMYGYWMINHVVLDCDTFISINTRYLQFDRL